MAKQIAEVKSINSFINKFLMENLDSEDHGVLMEAWNSEGIQKELQKLLPTSEKKIKDPNAPKRGKSSYLFFCEDHRAAAKERLEEAGGDYKATDVTKMLGTMWTELKDDVKRKKEFANYEKKSKEDKERYEREIASYVPPSEEELNDVGEEEGEQIEIGKCTYDKIKKEYNTSVLGDPTCCNPPSCVTDSEYEMNKNHLDRAYLIAALQVLFVILNGFYWKKGLTPHVRNKGILILALVSMLCGLFTYWDRPGDKYKLLFGISESITIPIFLLMIIFSLK